MHSYSPDDWTSFLVAIVSAAAALTGLLFVAVSINIERIIKGNPMLITRSAETLVCLVFIMISAALGLVPENSRLLGLEILILALPLVTVTLTIQLRWLRRNPTEPRSWSVTRIAASAATTVPGTLAGISLAAHWGGGFYWLVPTALAGIAGAVYAAWLLLIEILR